MPSRGLEGYQHALHFTRSRYQAYVIPSYHPLAIRATIAIEPKVLSPRRLFATWGMPEIIKESCGGAVYETDQGLIEAMGQLISDP